MINKIKNALGAKPSRIDIKATNIEDILKLYRIADEIGRVVFKNISLATTIIYEPLHDSEGEKLLKLIYEDRSEEDPTYRSTLPEHVDFERKYFSKLNVFIDAYRAWSNLKEAVYEPHYFGEKPVRIKLKTPPHIFTELKAELRIEIGRAKISGIAIVKEEKPKHTIALLKNYGIDEIWGLIVMQILPSKYAQERIKQILNH